MLRAMNDEEQTWVEDVARRFDAVVFWSVGRFGAQPLLLPRRLWVRRHRVRVSHHRPA